MMFFLCFFLTGLLLFGGFQIGPLSIRVYLTVLMFILIVLREKHKYEFHLTKKPITITILFLVICLFVKFLSQTLYSQQVDELIPFLKRCLAYFFPAFIAYVAIGVFIQSTDHLKLIFKFLLITGIINALVSWLQAQGNPIGIVIAKIFITGDSETIDYVSNRLDSLKTSFMAVPGIFGSGAKNGYMTASLGILPMYYVLNKGTIKKVIGALTLFIAIIGCFSCQERSAFGLLIIFCLFCMIKSKSKAMQYSIFIILLLGPLLFYEDILRVLTSEGAGRMARIVEFGNDRTELVVGALEFISTYFLLGGDVFYESMYKLAPHNFLLHSVIYGGIIGAVVIVYLFIYLLKSVYTVFKHNHSNSIVFIFGCSLCILLLNSLFHSTSLITGDATIWMFAALMFKSLELKKINVA